MCIPRVYPTFLFLLACETCDTEIQSETFQGDPREAFLRAALGTAIVWLGIAGRVCCALQSSKLSNDIFRFVQAIRCARGFSKNITVHLLYFIHFVLKINHLRGICERSSKLHWPRPLLADTLLCLCVKVASRVEQ